jgi:hypothetical protein
VSKYPPRFYPPIDTRVALGSQPLRPGQPAEACVCCFSHGLIQSDVYVEGCGPCCLHCAGNPNRVRTLPAYRADAWSLAA